MFYPTRSTTVEGWVVSPSANGPAERSPRRPMRSPLSDRCQRPDWLIAEQVEFQQPALMNGRRRKRAVRQKKNPTGALTARRVSFHFFLSLSLSVSLVRLENEAPNKRKNERKQTPRRRRRTVAQKKKAGVVPLDFAPLSRQTIASLI